MGIKEKGLIKELKENGFSYSNVDKIYIKQALEPVEVEIVLKWLPELYKEHLGTGDQAVRSLMSAKRVFDPSLLIDLFENSDLNETIKAGIGLTLSYANTTDISEWMKDQLLDKELRMERYALIDGLLKKGKFSSVKEYMNFLKKIFDRYGGEDILKLFKKYGDKDDMLFLAEKAKKAEPKFAKAINKVIEKKKV
ncbi:MAG TPA: hypothetical protein VHD83_20995 [Puia sp.]|nr:hypothetical protein [Puia sp.]